jgi:hypothetical protein
LATAIPAHKRSVFFALAARKLLPRTGFNFGFLCAGSNLVRELVAMQPVDSNSHDESTDMPERHACD